MSRNLASQLIHSWLLVLLCIFPLNGNCLPNANPCGSKSTCGECIQTPTCGWCLQPRERFRDIDRCFQPVNQSSTALLCPEEYIYSPMNTLEYLSIVQPSEEVYLSPQKIKAQLLVDSSLYIRLNCGVGGTKLPISIELKDISSSYVDIVYYSKCSNEAGPEIPTNKCTHIEGQVQFKIEIKLKECPKNTEEFSEIIDIYVVGEFAVSTIDLSMLCSCDCEKPDSQGYKENATQCNGVGTYKCGICECDPPYMGKRCECALDTYLNQNDTHGCKPPGSTETVECSGKGVCICNQCECDTQNNANDTISGRWCECDNFSCYRHGGEICGGHGRCDCGECKCDAPWTGKACDCYSATNTCFPPFQENQQLCNGHGDCICGVCQCQVTAEGRYTGRYCQRCPNCTETCDDLNPCVLCQIYHIGPYDDNECVERCKYLTSVEVEVVQANDENDEFLCAGYDEDDCRYVFAYKKVNETHYIVKAQRVRECSPKGPSLPAAASFITTERRNQKRQRAQDLQEQRQFMRACTAALQDTSRSEAVLDENDAFGKYVAEKLKKIKPESQKNYAETLIFQVIQKALLCQLSPNSIISENTYAAHFPQYQNPNNV